MIRDRILVVENKIKAVCLRMGRDPDKVILLGVTKTAQADRIREAIQAGLTHIGENRVQEAQRKFPLLTDLQKGVTRHMIGHLQTNKVKQAVEYFDVIQSVDNIGLAKEIDKRSAAINKVMNVLVQVNTSGELQKSGVSREEVFQLIEEMLPLPQVRVHGLMTMAPLSDDKDWVRRTFRDTRTLSEEIIKRFGSEPKMDMKYLSMGMSDDFEIALEEGSNMVRIGRAIFQDD